MTSSEHYQKYKDSINAYKATQYRSSYAIPKELKPGIEKVVEASGANSMSELIACLATRPDEAGALLRPFIEQTVAQSKPKSVKPLVKELASEATAEELQAFLEELRAKKAKGG